MSGSTDSAPAGAPPGFARRFACMLYEGVLLFGVVMVAGLIYGALTQQRHALVGTRGLQAVLFAVIGLYFAWFWAWGRQTVAMKTWHLRVVRLDGRPLTLLHAAVRYVASWLWFLPGLALAALLGHHEGGRIGGVLLAGVVIYALATRLTPGQRAPHDLLCGTRLEMWRPPARQNPAP